jgi:hypothetical protein
MVDVFTVEVHEVVVPRDIDERRARRPQDRLALAVAREVRVAGLVFDVVAEVDDEVWPNLVVHPADESARQIARLVGELSELALPPRLGAEVQVGDDAERQLTGHAGQGYTTGCPARRP